MDKRLGIAAITLLLIALGVRVYFNATSYLDEQGVVHEHFYLEPLSSLLFLAGLGLGVASLVARVRRGS